MHELRPKDLQGDVRIQLILLPGELAEGTALMAHAFAEYVVQHRSVLLRTGDRVSLGRHLGLDQELVEVLHGSPQLHVVFRFLFLVALVKMATENGRRLFDDFLFANAGHERFSGRALKARLRKGPPVLNLARYRTFW